MADRSALGWRPHSGWAILVVVAGSPASPIVRARQRIELLDGSLPRQPYHEAAEGGLSLAEGMALIRRVEDMAASAAATATSSAIAEFGVGAVGIVGGSRSIPGDLQRILASHLLLHAAEGDLFEQALLEGAARAGVPAQFVDPKAIEVGDALAAAGRSLGPPWRKDHRLAAAAALAALP